MRVWCRQGRKSFDNWLSVPEKWASAPLHHLAVCLLRKMICLRYTWLKTAISSASTLLRVFFSLGNGS
ncbi:Glutamyl-tRNA(Gln) amidotransferase subunit A [Fusarium oxysporum f. sp. albedinis]|nr:Glutamyl-tRNA(Gln) amidotransferase subunit A [Fusarium oxysporum f. sp. albedinis]